jgi:hypothetical protein
MPPNSAVPALDRTRYRYGRLSYYSILPLAWHRRELNRLLEELRLADINELRELLNRPLVYKPISRRISKSVKHLKITTMMLFKDFFHPLRRQPWQFRPAVSA